MIVIPRLLSSVLNELDDDSAVQSLATAFFLHALDGNPHQDIVVATLIHPYESIQVHPYENSQAESSAVLARSWEKLHTLRELVDENTYTLCTLFWRCKFSKIDDKRSSRIILIRLAKTAQKYAARFSVEEEGQRSWDEARWQLLRVIEMAAAP